MKKTAIILLCIIALLALCVFAYKITSELQQSNDSQNTTTQENVVSQPSENLTSISFISYTHPSNKFTYSYPSTWEFVPKREDMGLRPKAYGGFSKNEIVTIIYFEGKGVDLESWVKTYDGGFDEDWVTKSVYGKDGLFYNYSSDNLNNLIYWFSNGTDAVKVMFRKYYSFGVEGQKDNSQYESDFNKILETFKFL